MTNIDEYLVDLKDRIESKQMTNMWVMTERQDFKPLKNLTLPEIKKMLKERSSHYANKKIANIKIFILPSKEKCVKLVIDIYQIHEDASIDKNRSDTWGLMVEYEKYDLEERKFLLKDVQQLMKWVSDELITSDVFLGISYKKLVKEMKKKKLSFD